MGLDMYVYRVSMLSEEERAEIKGYKDRNDVDDKYIVVGYDERCLDAVWDIIPYAVKTKIGYRNVDLDAIRRYNNIPVTWKLCYGEYNSNEFTYNYGLGDDKITIRIPTKDIEERYTIVEQEEVLIFKGSDVAYWRKAYDLQEKLYKLYNDATGRCIQNCGFHRMTDSMIEAAMYDGEADLPMLKDGEALFYWEWY